MAKATIRPFVPGDLDALYALSLETGDRGGDASALYADPKLMGHIYSAPYAVLVPALALVLEQNGAVAGFALGVADTAAFEVQQEQDWWPRLRASYRAPDVARQERWTMDERRIHAFHHPARAPRSILPAYPAHMHMNLLPSAQGQGFGSALLRQWLARLAMHGPAAGVHMGVHVGVNAANTRALAFWQAKGFRPLAPDPSETSPRTRWLGLTLTR